MAARPLPDKLRDRLSMRERLAPITVEMPGLRQHILKAMLGALGATALAAVAAVAFSNSAMWRIAGTTMAGTFVTLVMLRFTAMTDQPRTRWAGLAGTIGTLSVFLLVMGLIWEVHDWLPGRWDESELLGTAGIMVLVTGFAMVFLKLIHAADTRVAGRTGLVLTAGCLVLSLVAIWMPWRAASPSSSYYRVLEQLWGTVISIGVIGLLAVAALVGVGKDRRHWRWVGVASCLGGLWAALGAVWERGTEHENLLALFLAVAFWVALAIPLLHIELKREHRWLRLATLVAGGLAASLWTLLVWGLDEDFGVRAAAACSILTACGIMSLGVLARLGRRLDTQDLPRELRTITLFCPRCNRKQTLPLGASACGACGIKLEIRAEQPSCRECGYLLYGGADRCPECGTAVVPQAEAA